jgi:hypothetical protein
MGEAENKDCIVEHTNNIWVISSHLVIVQMGRDHPYVISVLNNAIFVFSQCFTMLLIQRDT